MARRITLDELAAMVARGFEDLRREIREGFAVAHAVLDDHTGTLSAHSEILSAHGEILKDHTHRLDRIERKLDNTTHRVDDHDVRLQTLEQRRGPRS